jgi:hypothetical protein
MLMLKENEVSVVGVGNLGGSESSADALRNGTSSDSRGGRRERAGVGEEHGDATGKKSGISSEVPRPSAGPTWRLWDVVGARRVLRQRASTTAAAAARTAPATKDATTCDRAS